MTTPQEKLLPGTRRALLHRIAAAQAEGRAPSLVAAVVRGGEPVWHGSRTSVDGHGPDENVQYRIGSITKTFTAVLVLRLRDEGLLDLGDPLEKHLPGTGAGEATIAQLLAHTAGLAAETPGPWWERTPGSLRPELSDVLSEQPFLHPAGRLHHYSNPGYTLLGALIEELRGVPWEEMRTPAAPLEADQLASGDSYGLGLQVLHRSGRILVGHSGSLPGFLAALAIGVEDDVAAVVLSNCTSGPRVLTVATDLVRIVVEAEPRIPESWRPAAEVDQSVLELAGPWYWGTQACALRLRADGMVELGPLAGGGRGSRFRANGDGTWTGLDGYYLGEPLRAVRRPDGSLSHLDLGSFVFTRQPYDEGAPVPGGVDPEGWRGIQ
ncbi:serine hydrolase domain-containing protein [Streptomyces mirabilis]|uniref:serine hydrolase domain-containing protein n=1 Tax=Streptomyces mirabilis TaxID=68239 RepID=UPI0036CD9955